MKRIVLLACALLLGCASPPSGTTYLGHGDGTWVAPRLPANTIFCNGDTGECEHWEYRLLFTDCKPGQQRLVPGSDRISLACGVWERIK